MVAAVVVSRRFVLIAAVCGASLCGATSSRGDEPVAAAPSVLPVEFQSYRVRCVIAADPFTAADSEASRLVRDLPSWVARQMGQRWQFAAAAAADPAWALAGLAVSDSAGDDFADVDVGYRVVVRRQGSRVVAEIRSFEPLFHFASPLRTVACLDDRELGATVASELLSLFRPRAAWERQDDRTVRMRVQGAALSAGESERSLAASGDVFAPALVFRNRQKQVQKLQEYPWTYVVIDAIDDGRGTAHVVSGLRNPLGAKPRGRIEQIAVAVRPLWPESTVQVFARSQPPRPLPAHQLELSDIAVEADPLAPLRKLTTDRDGEVRLARGESPQLQWLRVTSGDLLLAKVPLLPGAFPTARLELPDDRVRLHAEGELKVLQGDVVSIVAQRTALIATARAAGKQRQWDVAKLRLRQLDALPSPQSLRERVSSIRVPAVTSAREQRDKVSEQRVNRLCNDTEELIQHYLADDKVKQVKEELAELEAALKVE